MTAQGNPFGDVGSKSHNLLSLRNLRMKSS